MKAERERTYRPGGCRSTGKTVLQTMTATQQSAETAHTTRHATFSTSLIAPTGGVRAVRLIFAPRRAVKSEEERSS